MGDLHESYEAAKESQTVEALREQIKALQDENKKLLGENKVLSEKLMIAAAAIVAEPMECTEDMS